MRLLICASLLLAACTAGDGNAEKRSTIEPSTESPIERVGTLENRKLDEASGLAHSRLDPGILWVINDGGPAVVYAIDHTGRERGRVKITDAKNKDWEDIASFSVDGTAYLMIADIGDNEAKRKDVTLYVIEEPALDDARADIAWRINFSYPDGPRDAEALAVDSAGQRIYVLSKRDIPAVLYAMPLLPPVENKHDTIIATRLGEIDSLPQPSAREKKNSKGSGWHWQPTGMDFSVAGDRALILTYGGVYLYARDGKQTWLDALNGRPLGLSLGKIKKAESIAFAPGGDSAFVTVEKKHAALLRIDISGVTPSAAQQLGVAFLSKLPPIGPAILHSLSLKNLPERECDTRGILQTTFELPDGSLLTEVNHENEFLDDQPHRSHSVNGLGFGGFGAKNGGDCPRRDYGR